MWPTDSDAGFHGELADTDRFLALSDVEVDADGVGGDEAAGRRVQHHLGPRSGRHRRLSSSSSSSSS